MYEITIKGTTAEEIRMSVSDLAKMLNKIIPGAAVDPQQAAAMMNPMPPIQTPAPNAAAAYQTQQPAPNPAAAYPVQPPAAVPVVPQAAPVQQPAPVPVPTTGGTPTYTLEQLSVAATPIMDAGRQQELVALLNQFGVQALTQLPKEQYGAFATALRGLGARI